MSDFLYKLSIIIFALPVTVCEITAFNLQIMVVIGIFDLPKLSEGHELQHYRNRRWMAFCGLHDGEKWWIYLKPFSTGPPTVTDKHTATIAIREKAQRVAFRLQINHQNFFF